jgi:hypothetical protein
MSRIKKRKPTVASLTREVKQLKEDLEKAKSAFVPYKNALTKIYDVVVSCKSTEKITHEYILKTCKEVFK